MYEIYQEHLDEIRELNLMKNSLNVHYLWQYKFMKKRYNLKLADLKKRDELVRKFRLKHPSITDAEIANFIRIYLQYEPDENNCI